MSSGPLEPEATYQSGASDSIAHEVATGDLNLLVQRTDKIISLLEVTRGRTRVDVAAKAESVSSVLDALAIIVLIVGALAAISGVITIFVVGLFAGLGIVLAAAFTASLYWALLMLGSVVAGYVSNKS